MDRLGAARILLTGAELKALRKKLGLSLAQASRQVEVSARTWARWEAGDQSIPEGALKLFRILNGLEKVEK
jgi:DNA-binding transcriptional regulator YiaG